MPDHDSFSGAEFPKLFRLILSSSPKPNHVEIGLDGIINQILNGVFALIIGVNKARVHYIRWNIVGSLAVDRISINRYPKVGSLVQKINRFIQF